ncbi:MAG: hypothetical protein AB7K04_05260 [Pseudorhodoplanes sp.]
MLVENKLVPVQIKLVRDIVNIERTKVDEPAFSGGGVDSNWFQRQLINPPDSGDVLDSATAQHKSRSTYEAIFWFHQFALCLGGDMTAQDLTTGEVFRAREGDFYHWAPGTIIRLGGEFLALGIRTPVPQRWVRTASGGKKEVVMHTLKDEITFPGAKPDEVKPAQPRPLQSRMKVVRGATKVKMPGGSADVKRVLLVTSAESDLIGSCSIEERTRGRIAEQFHRWHQVGLMLDGELVTQNLDTGEVFRAKKGDLFYWGPALRHSIEGEYRMYTVRTPEPVRNIAGNTGGEVDLLGINEVELPRAKADEVLSTVLTEV